MIPQWMARRSPKVPTKPAPDSCSEVPSRPQRCNWWPTILMATLPLIFPLAVFIGGYAFGHWVTTSDPAFLRILAKSENYKPRYDAAKQDVPRVEVV